MAETGDVHEVPQIAFESFGVTVGVVVEDPSLLPLLEGLAPVPSADTDPTAVDHRLALRRSRATGLYNVRFDRREGEELEERDHTAWMAGDADLDFAIGSLDAHIQSLIALHAVGHTVIRAGVVSYRGTGIMLPGGPLTGKSTLVRELVAAGAVRYSDDWAPINGEGRVHPYLRPTMPGISASGAGREQMTVDGLEPLRISAIVLTGYSPNARWQPTTLSQGEAVLALMEYAESGSERDDTFTGITKLIESQPVVLKSDRPDAAAAAPAILADVERALSQAA